jgi:hypothetical protein
MPNHVRLILYPYTAEGLALALGAAHRRLVNFVNARGRWRGHLFDGRFASVAMDDAHLLTAVRYVTLNPVRSPSPCVPGGPRSYHLAFKGKIGALGAIRTPDPQIRSLMLYPAELRARAA